MELFQITGVHIGYIWVFSADLWFEILLKIPFGLHIVYRGIIKVLRNLGQTQSTFNMCYVHCVYVLP